MKTDTVADNQVRVFTRANGVRFEVSLAPEQWAEWDSMAHADEAAEIEAEMQAINASVYVPTEAGAGLSAETQAALTGTLSPETRRAIAEHDAVELVKARRAAVRMGIGSIDCAGGCGARVSVNKGFCRTCYAERGGV